MPRRVRLRPLDVRNDDQEEVEMAMIEPEPEQESLFHSLLLFMSHLTRYLRLHLPQRGKY